MDEKEAGERLFRQVLHTDDVVAAVTARVGGVSNLPFDSANMALHVGDDPAAVLENRARACRELGINLRDLVCAQQVHGNRIVAVTDRDRGRGALSADDALPGVDGMVTAAPGVPLAVFTADCVPIFLYDPAKRVVGIVHAGWRGTLLRIAESLMDTARNAFGTDPASCQVVLGPAAGPCCYEVGEDAVNAFRERGHSVEDIFRRKGDGKHYLGLWRANELQFERCGVHRENISVTERCTVCSGAYFSCRRDGAVTGRGMSVIMLVCV